MAFDALPRIATLAGLGQDPEATAARVAEVRRTLAHVGQLMAVDGGEIPATYTHPPAEPGPRPGDDRDPPDPAALRGLLVALEDGALLVPAPAAGRPKPRVTPRAAGPEPVEPPRLDRPAPAAPSRGAQVGPSTGSVARPEPTTLRAVRAALADVGAAAQVETTLAVIDAHAPLNAFVAVDPAGARAAARATESRAGDGWAGVPVAVKANLWVKDRPVDAGSRILAGFVAPEDATAVARLRRAGAIVVGQTNLDELGMGSSTELGAAGPTENPVAPGRVAGGSSGGSAAAVAAGLVPVALGSDTGGSIRQPAAFCGVVGLKPTWGRVSRRGLVAFASSLDTVGPLAATVRDAGEALELIAGPDAGDATSADRPLAGLADAAGAGVRGLTVGVPVPCVDVDGDLLAAVRAARDALVDAGATTRPVDLPHAGHALSAYVIIAAAEASSNLARLDGVRYGRRARGAADLETLYERSRSEGFGPEVQRRIIAGTFVLAEGHDAGYFDRAARLRTALIEDYRRAFDDVDLLLGPTTPEPPFARASRLSDPLALYRTDALTVGPSLAGLPALAVPFGVTREGLPASVQLVAPWWREDQLIAAGAVLEAEAPRVTARTPPD